MGKRKEFGSINITRKQEKYRVNLPKRHETRRYGHAGGPGGLTGGLRGRVCPDHLRWREKRKVRKKRAASTRCFINKLGSRIELSTAAHTWNLRQDSQNHHVGGC